MPIEIELVSNTLEILSFYGVLLILDSQNSLFRSKLKLAIYIAFSSLVATDLSILNIPYDFALMVFNYIILMKILSKRPIGKITIDVINASACIVVVEFLWTILFSLFRVDIIEDHWILIGSLIGMCSIIFLLNRWNRFVVNVQTVYHSIREGFSLIVVNSFFFVLILLNLWHHFRDIFYNEKWMLLGLMGCNYMINIGFIVIYRRQKYARAESDAYKAYSEHLKDVSERLRSQQHEFNNQIQTIIGLALATPNGECSQRIIQFCDQLIQNRKKKVETSSLENNIIIEAMGYSRRRLAEEKNVLFHYTVFDPLSGVKLSSYELSEVLNNLLNNAFEAVYDLPIDKRIVNLVVSDHTIEVLNYVSDDFDEKLISLFDQRGYSTKGKFRGYGLINIKTIIGKYNGSFQMNREGDIFCVEILFE